MAAFHVLHNGAAVVEDNAVPDNCQRCFVGLSYIRNQGFQTFQANAFLTSIMFVIRNFTLAHPPLAISNYCTCYACRYTLSYRHKLYCTR